MRSCKEWRNELYLYTNMLLRMTHVRKYLLTARAVMTTIDQTPNYKRGNAVDGFLSARAMPIFASMIHRPVSLQGELSKRKEVASLETVCASAARYYENLLSVRLGPLDFAAS